MIKVEKGTVTLKGSGLMLEAELSCAVEAMKNNYVEIGMSKEDAKGRMLRCVELAFMDKETLEEEMGRLDKALELDAAEISKLLEWIKEELR